MHMARTAWLDLWRWIAPVALPARPAPRRLWPATSRSRSRRASIDRFSSAARSSSASPSSCRAPGLGRSGPATKAPLKASAPSAKSGAVNSLTPAGRRACQAGQPGFCYSAGFAVVMMLDVAALTEVQGRGVADRVRTATAPIAQEPGADWARGLRGTAMASDGTAPSTGPRFYPSHCRMLGARMAFGLMSPCSWCAVASMERGASDG